jgi:hypothetical protein
MQSYLPKVRLLPYIKRKKALGLFLDHAVAKELLFVKKSCKSHYFRIRGDLKNLVNINVKFFSIDFGLKNFIDMPVSFFFNKKDTVNSNKFMFRSTLSGTNLFSRFSSKLTYFSEHFLSLISTFRANLNLKFKSFIPSYMC